MLFSIAIDATLSRLCLWRNKRCSTVSTHLLYCDYLPASFSAIFDAPRRSWLVVVWGLLKGNTHQSGSFWEPLKNGFLETTSSTLRFEPTSAPPFLDVDGCSSTKRISRGLGPPPKCNSNHPANARVFCCSHHWSVGQSIDYITNLGQSLAVFSLAPITSFFYFRGCWQRTSFRTNPISFAFDIDRSKKNTNARDLYAYFNLHFITTSVSSC